MKSTKYIGFLLGALYGIIIRFIGGLNTFENFYNVFSITFFWITPIVISLIPIFYAKNEISKSKLRSFLYPILAVFLFFVFAFITGFEDFACILIIAFPFLLTAGIVGIVVSLFIKDKPLNKKLYSIVLLPFILNPIENTLPNKKEQFSIVNEIVINDTKSNIWKNLIEVPEIKENGYEKGFFYHIGIPRPIKSELKKIQGQIYRIGYFSDNLELYETISQQEKNNFLKLEIHIDKSKLRNRPTDQHVFKSNYFQFNHISYKLIRINEDQTKLILNCNYQLNSKMNGYANFWANSIISDFETRLLNSLKKKIEK